MLKFNKVQTLKYSQNSISGTGLLAFRDIEMFSKRNNADLSYVLDVGCANGIYSIPCASIAKNVTGVDINKKLLISLKNN